MATSLKSVFTTRLFLLVQVVAFLNGQAERTCNAGSSGNCIDTWRRAGYRGSSLVQLRGEVGKVQAGLYSRSSATTVDASMSGAMDAHAAAHMQNHLAAPKNLGLALAAGLMAVHGALPKFVAEPPEITEGFQHLGTGLFDAIEMMLPANVTGLQKFADFSEAWDEAVVSLPSIVQDFTEKLKAYREDGDASALLEVCRTTLMEMGTLVAQFLPTKVGIEVTKYLGAIEDALEGLDGAIESFASGNTTEAIQAVYSGLRLATNSLIPPGLQNDETYKAVVGAVDSVFKDLSETMLRYQQKMLQSKVCWKSSTKREAIRPDQCPPNHFWDGDHWCSGVREGASRPMQIKNQHGICLDAKDKDSRRGKVQMWGCDRKNPNQQWVFSPGNGHIKNLHGYCLDASQRKKTGGRILMWPCADGNKNQEWVYHESKGQIKSKDGYCLDAEQFSSNGGGVQSYPCDTSAKNQQWSMTSAPAESDNLDLLEHSVTGKRRSNTVPAHCDEKSNFNEQRGAWCYKSCPYGTDIAGSRCKTACIGAYPINSPLMCGKSPGTIAASLREMVTRTFKTGLKALTIIASAGAAGGLQNTIKALVDLGEGFAHPGCPVLGKTDDSDESE